jgi:hypothetical protein
MTWSVNATIVGNSADDELEGLRTSALSQNSECGDQFDAAKDAAYSLMASGAFGTASKKFQINMVGHANPNHEPREGWATDSVTISVSQVKDS